MTPHRRSSRTTLIAVVVAPFIAGVIGIHRPVSAAQAGAWIENPSNGHQYQVIECGTWLDCNETATALRGYLVAINDAGEQAWLTQTFGTTENFWIGLTDELVEGTYRWTSGEPVTFTNWAPEEPNDFFCSEDYVLMNFYSAPSSWNDAGPCSQEWWSRIRAIVEKNPRRPTVQFRIAIAPASTLRVFVGQQILVNPTLLNPNGRAVAGTFRWTSSNPSVAVVANGFVEGRAFGVAYLTVTEIRTNIRRTVPVKVDGDQYYWTADPGELQYVLATNSNAWEYDRVAFDVLLSGDQPSLVPLWRLTSTAIGTHFWTTDLENDVVGPWLPPNLFLYGTWVFWRDAISPPYVYSAPVDGAVPVYRWHNETTDVRFWSTDPSGESFGEDTVLEGVAFYALPAGSGVPGAVPMHRVRCHVCGLP